MRATRWDIPAAADVQTSAGSRREARCDGRSSAALQPAVAIPESADRLSSLKTLISNRRTLLANVGRSNQQLANDNTRMELELAERREPVPASADPQENTLSIAGNAQAKLLWIENYIHGTLAQTLWALNARAVHLEAQATSADQQQAHRLLEMTHAAYDQLRDLMTWLHSNAHD